MGSNENIPSGRYMMNYSNVPVNSEIPHPHYGKLQIWDDQSLLRNSPPQPKIVREFKSKIFRIPRVTQITPYLYFLCYSMAIPQKCVQECIPVGCVPSAAVAVWGVSAWGGGVRGGSVQRGVYLPPLTDFFTHACENITFPQLLLRTVTSCICM